MLAPGSAYPDALTGSPLAATLDAPLLLTTAPRLEANVAAEITRLGADRVIVLGGTSAVPDGVEQDLLSLGLAVDRLAGEDRFATAGLVADTIGIGDVVVLAEGANNDPARGWPDAVTGSGLAAGLGVPILLTTVDVMPFPTAERLLDVEEVLLVGGEAAVSETIAAEATHGTSSVIRLAGPDRYATSHDVALEAQRRGVDPSIAYVATGRDWPDGLAAAAAAGAVGGMLLLVDGTDQAAWLCSPPPRSSSTPAAPPSRRSRPSGWSNASSNVASPCGCSPTTRLPCCPPAPTPSRGPSRA